MERTPCLSTSATALLGSTILSIRPAENIKKGLQPCFLFWRSKMGQVEDVARAVFPLKKNQNYTKYHEKGSSCNLSLWRFGGVGAKFRHKSTNKAPD